MIDRLATANTNDRQLNAKNTVAMHALAYLFVKKAVIITEHVLDLPYKTQRDELRTLLSFMNKRIAQYEYARENKIEIAQEEY